MPTNYQFLVVNTCHDGVDNEESPLVFFETEQEARNYIRDSFDDSEHVEAGYLIVPLDKCIAVWAEHCSSMFTDVGYEDVM